MAACQPTCLVLCHLVVLSYSLNGRTPQLIMQNPENHDLGPYSLGSGSPLPTIACPYCPRFFKTKSGHTRHIQAKHTADNSEPHAPATAAHPSLTPLSFHNPTSPVPSHFAAPSPSSSRDEFNLDGADSHPSPQSFHDRSPVPSHFAPSPSSSRDEFNLDGADLHPSPQYFHDRSPGPSHFAPSFQVPPSCDGFSLNADHDMDIASPILSSPQRSFHNPSPVLSHLALSFPPSCDGSESSADLNDDMDISDSHTSSIPSSSQPSSHDACPVPSCVSDASHITRVFHPKLNGM